MNYKLLLAVLMACLGAFALEIANGGKSDYVIVTKDKAPKTTVYCAKHLQKYMKSVADVDMQIATAKPAGKKAIYIGAHSELPKQDIYNAEKYVDDETYRITELPGGDISIMGADCDISPISRKNAVFGLLWGTYSFIEKFLGVRWYAPGIFGECFDKLDKVTVTDLPIEVTPPLYCRSMWPYQFLGFENNDSLEYGRHLRAHGKIDLAGNHSMQDLAFFAKDQDEIFALEADGKTRNKGIVKSFSKDGTAQWTRYPHYCFTNPATVKAYCDFIDAVYENKPEGKLWKVKRPNEYCITMVPDDNYTTQPCYCKNCQALIDRNAGRASMTPLVWGFVKQVAEWAKKKYPDKVVSTIAYESYYLPPKFDLPDNVAVQICINPYIIYQGCEYYQKQSDNIINAWSKKTKHLQVWHYIMPYDSLPYAMPHIMYNWHARYPNVKSSFLELNNSRRGLPYLPKNIHNGQTFDLPQTHLNLYFAFKGMSGEKIDVDKELELYYRYFWGPAAAPMKRFCETQQNAWEKMTVKKSGDSAYSRFTGKEIYEEIYPANIVKTLNDCFAEAKKLAPEGSIYAKRLDWIYMGYLKAFTENAEAYAKELNNSKDVVLFTKEGEPVIDGNLDDDFWKGLETYSFQKNDSPLPATYGTTFKMAVNKDKLFFAINATDPQAKNQKLTSTTHDSNSVYGDDSIEVFIKPGNKTGKRFFNVTANLNCVVLDYVAGDRKLDVSYESGVEVKTVRGEAGYTMEMAIPLANLEIPENGILGINVCRNKRSGVGEVHESSCWSCTYGSFWNFSNMPNVTLSSKADAFAYDFTKEPKKVYIGVQTMPNDKPGKRVQEGARYEFKDGILTLYYTLTKDNFRYDYGTYTVPLKKNEANGAQFIDIRFRNPDEAISHTITWSYTDAEGKKHGDWMRFCHHEKHTDWRVRTIDTLNDGNGAVTRKRKGQPPLPEAKSLDVLQIYSSPKRDGKERHIDIDYIRFHK